MYFMNADGEDCGQDNSENYQLSLADRWIISLLQQTMDAVVEGINAYRLDLASQALYEFFWNEYCDWYLELSKPVLWDETASDAQKKGTRRTLVRVLETALRIAHPFIPFISEEIWQKVAGPAGQSGDTIMLQSFPQSDAASIDPDAIADIDWVKGVIIGIRNIRGEMNIAPGKALPVFFKNGDATDKLRLDENRQYLIKLAKLEDIQWLEADEEAPASSTALVGAMELHVPMAGLIDKEAENARLSKEIDKLKKRDSESFGQTEKPKVSRQGAR